MNTSEEHIYSLLLDYNEGNLNEEDCRLVEDFLKNPKYRAMQEKYSRINYLNEDMVFENKNDILSHSQKQKIINRRLRRQRNIFRYISIVSSAVAVIFLCLLITKPQQETSPAKIITKNSPPIEKIVYMRDTIYKNTMYKDTALSIRSEQEYTDSDFYRSVFSLFEFGMIRSIENVKSSYYTKADTCARIEFCNEDCRNNGNIIFEVENKTVKGTLCYSIN